MFRAIPLTEQYIRLSIRAGELWAENVTGKLDVKLQVMYINGVPRSGLSTAILNE